MKRDLFFALIVCAILTGCKNNNNEPTSAKKVGACYFKVEFNEFMNARAHLVVYENGKEVASLNNENPEYIKDGIDLSKETEIEASLQISGEAPTEKYDAEFIIYNGAAVATGTSALKSINIHADQVTNKGHKADTYEKHMEQLEKSHHYKYRFVNGSVTEVNVYIDD